MDLNIRHSWVFKSGSRRFDSNLSILEAASLIREEQTKAGGTVRAESRNGEWIFVLGNDKILMSNHSLPMEIACVSPEEKTLYRH